MADQRVETDSLGEVSVPAAAYWGAQTQRSLENFPFGATEHMPIAVIHALGAIKLAAAKLNRAHGLDPALGDAETFDRVVRPETMVGDLGVGTSIPAAAAL